MSTPVTEVLSNWYYYFEQLQFSTQDFYQQVETIIKERQIPDVKISRITYKEKAGLMGALFSSGREYLRIECDKLIFDICAAPYGTGFFVSWWLGTTTGFGEELFKRVPGVGGVVSRMANAKTYYQVDVSNMFKESVRQAVLQTIDNITKSKGLRLLTEMERKVVEA